MRLIDADALIESICHTADLGGWIGDTLRNIKRLAVRYINETPSIDIVRCKECIHCADDYIDVGMGTMPQFTCELGRCGESVQPMTSAHTEKERASDEVLGLRILQDNTRAVAVW